MEMVQVYRQSKVLLREHEGLKLQKYKCTGDKWTIGYGHNLEDNGIPEVIQEALDQHGEITVQIAELVLEDDIYECCEKLERFDWFTDLSSTVKAALVDLHFCVGHAGFRKFRMMIAALERRDYNEAAVQILDSMFAAQTGRRAQDLAIILRMG